MNRILPFLSQPVPVAMTVGRVAPGVDPEAPVA